MPDAQPNIYLIGYRCTGKSTVGRELAGQGGLSFYDTDEVIAAGQQRRIAQIVADRGWDHFRELEKKALRQLSTKGASVVATGGGIVLQPANIACMQTSGTIIWLRAELHTIMARLLQDPATADSRPALTRQSLEEEVRATLAARLEHYRRAADLSVRTDSSRPDDIAARILAMLAGRAAS